MVASLAVLVLSSYHGSAYCVLLCLPLSLLLFSVIVTSFSHVTATSVLHVCSNCSDVPSALLLSTSGHVFCNLGDRHDWTTGGPHGGNERGKYRSTYLRPLSYAYSHRSGSKNAFGLPEVTCDRFRCTVGLLPGHIWCRVM